MESWTDRARRRMKAKNISFKAMGDELGLSESMVSRQLSGSRNVNMNQVKVYGKVLGLPLSELLGDES